MLIDVHVHYGFLFFPIDKADADSLITTMDKFDIDFAVVSNLRGIFYDFRDCNSEMFSAIEKYPKRLKGYIVLNPHYPDISFYEFDKFKDHPQFAGVKLHASWHNTPIDGKLFAPILERCENENAVVLIHSYVLDDYEDQVSSPDRVATTAKRYTNPFIMAHMGGNARRTCRVAAGIENLYVDISLGRERAEQLYVWQPELLNLAVREMGAEHILFGTDFPLLDPSICLGLLEDSELSPEQRELISWKNASKVLRLGLYKT